MILNDLYGFLKGKRKGGEKAVESPRAEAAGDLVVAWRGRDASELSEGGIGMTNDWADVRCEDRRWLKEKCPLVAEVFERHHSGKSSEEHQRSVF